LGFGAGHIGSADLKDSEVEKLLNEVVDRGINLIDTARGYHLSEERIGKFLCQKRRDEIVLSTKVGYGVEGVADWTYDAVYKGIDDARNKMQTDVIDIVFLHSCARFTLVRGEVMEALEKARSEGKIKVFGYSGENEILDYAIYTNRMQAVQTSINLFDQRVLHTSLPKAKQHALGVIAKRPIGNAPWRFQEVPTGHYAEEYWHRMKTMHLDFGDSWLETAIRFTCFWYGVDTAIVGTTNLKHLDQNIAAVNLGKLDEDLIHYLIGLFRTHDKHWLGQV
jgi:aryl-alcohol dehydrogenase-like predicted oxidoreductase